MVTPPDGPVDRAARCPLCGGPNACGMAQGHGECWCAAATVPPEVLARVPDASRDVCVCHACAQSGGAARRAASD